MDTGSRNAKVTVSLRLLLILSHLCRIFPLAKFGQMLNVEFSAELNYSFMYSIFRVWNATALVHLAFDLTSCKPLPNFISVFAAVNGRKLRRMESLQLALMSILVTWCIHFTVSRLHVTLMNSDIMAATDISCSYQQFIAIEGIFEVSSYSQHLLNLNPTDVVRHESIYSDTICFSQ